MKITTISVPAGALAGLFAGLNFIPSNAGVLLGTLLGGLIGGVIGLLIRARQNNQV